MSREILSLQHVRACQPLELVHCSDAGPDLTTVKHPASRVSHRIVSFFVYCIAIFTVLLSCPPCLRVRERPNPGALDAGIGTFTWYSPTNPGVSPAKFTGSSIPFTIAVTAVLTRDNWPLFVTAPKPVAYTI